MNQITTIAIDLAKHVFQVAAEDRLGQEQWQKRVRSRQALTALIGTWHPPLTVVLEAGLGAQAWARGLQAQGLTVRVLPAHRVAKHRSGPKNDCNDARALLRAARDSSIHAVPVKTVAQLTMQALHRVRAGWQCRRTAIGNQVRGLLLEQGIVIAKGDRALTHCFEVMRMRMPVPERLQQLLDELEIEWRHLGTQIAGMTSEFAALARQDPTAQRLHAIAGIGPVTATALACKQLDPARFANSRQFAASFGLVPDQHSSGTTYRLGRMSKRGDRYVRSLLICGAHAVVRTIRTDADDPLSRRVRRWRERHGHKGAAVRLANHNLRVVWAMLQYDTTYHR